MNTMLTDPNALLLCVLALVAPFTALAITPDATLLGAVSSVSRIQALNAQLGPDPCPGTASRRPAAGPQLAGRETSGGSELRDYHFSSAWFADPTRPVRACVLVSADFGMTNEEGVSLLRSSFQAWTDYIEINQIQPKAPANGFATNLQIIENCDGSEDLKVAFGASDPQIAEAMTHFNRPIGFAQSLSQDNSAHWARGVVWIAPLMPEFAAVEPRIRAYMIQAVLRHELGHTFGNGEVPGTIMRDNLGQALMSIRNTGSEELAKGLIQIDQERALISNNRVDLSIRPDSVTQRRMDFGFRRLMGRPSQGQIVAHLQAPVGQRLQGTLTLQDSQGSKSFRISGRNIFCSRMGDITFATALSNNRGFGGYNSAVCTGRGELVDTETGTVTAIDFQKDSPHDRFKITLADVDENYANEVFTTDSTNWYRNSK